MKIPINSEELRKIQLIQLELLIEVDRICRKYDIKYNIIAGTLLGAIRHKGYIPWDDDADVAFLRDEYERFRIVCETELNTDKYYFQDDRNTDGYRWGYGKLRRKNTVFLRENQEHMPYEQGVFIDIFPLDNVPNNYFLRCIHNFKCFCFRKILWSEVGKYEHKNILIRKWYWLISKIPRNKIFSRLTTFRNRVNNHQSDWVRILTFPTPNREYGYKKYWYEQSEDINFEGYIFSGIKNYDEYLSFKFGDYMKLPPQKDRKVHPVSKLELLD